MPVPPKFRFGASGQGNEPGDDGSPADPTNLLRLARRCEALGYDTFLVPDHLPDQLAPLPALAGIAAATERIRLGTGVLANDFRHPVLLAKEAATVDILSGGRLELGIGAGWMRPEFEAAGIGFGSAPERIARLEEAVRVVTGLWSGQSLTMHGQHYQVTDLATAPVPVQRPRPPVLIGGGGLRVLDVAARHADIVSVGVRATPAGRLRASDLPLRATVRRVEHVRRCAGQRARTPELNWPISSVLITDDRRATAQGVLDLFAAGHPDVELDAELTVDDVLDSPYLAIGTPAQIAEQLVKIRDVTGMSYPSVFPTHADAFAPVVALLTGR